MQVAGLAAVLLRLVLVAQAAATLPAARPRAVALQHLVVVVPVRQAALLHHGHLLAIRIPRS